MTRASSPTAHKTASTDSADAGAEMTDPPGAGPATEAWRIVSDMVLDNERRRKVADTLGLSFGRARALRRIAKGPKSMRELAAALGIDAPHLTLVVDDLERQRLVERRPHPTDRRVKLVAATRRGEEAARRADSILGTPPDGLAALDLQDLTDLVRILRKAAAPVDRGP